MAAPRLPRQGPRAGRRNEPLRNPIVDVMEAVEPTALQLDHGAQRAPVELHVGEVLEQNVVRLVRRALELLAGERCSVRPREPVDFFADDDPQVLETHLVDALADGRDELDERDDLASAETLRRRPPSLILDLKTGVVTPVFRRPGFGVAELGVDTDRNPCSGGHWLPAARS